MGSVHCAGMNARGFLPSQYIILDSETSGMRPGDGHSIVELAAQKIRGRDVIDEFLMLVNPGHALDPEAAAVHGITELALIAKGSPPATVFRSFLRFIESLPLVAHNVGFDIAFLNEHHRRLDLPPLANPLIDSIVIARQHLLLPSYSLESVARFLKIPQPNAHRALADVITLREVLFRIEDRATARKA